MPDNKHEVHVYICNLIYDEQGWCYSDYDYGHGWIRYHQLLRNRYCQGSKSMYLPFMCGTERIYISEEELVYIDNDL